MDKVLMPAHPRTKPMPAPLWRLVPIGMDCFGDPIDMWARDGDVHLHLELPVGAIAHVRGCVVRCYYAWGDYGEE